MNPSNFHSSILQSLASSYGMDSTEVDLFLQKLELVTESQKFLSGAQRLPVSCMKLAVGFVQKYLGIYPHASFKSHGYNKFELQYFRYEDGVKVGLGLVVKHGETSMYSMINVNGASAIAGNKTFLL